MSAEQIPLNIAQFSGPLLLGHLFNWGLYGVLTVQVFIYYISFPSDKWQAKTIVWTIYLLETVQTILATHDAFISMAKGWGNIESLQKPQLLWFSVPVMDGIISFTVQNFLSWRIYAISRSKAFAGLLFTLSLLQATSGVIQGIQTAIIGNFTKLQAEAFVSLVLWLGGSALVDVLIASGMTYCLLRIQPNFKQTQLLIFRVIRLSVETGMITATIAVLDLILFLTVKTDYYICPAFVLAKFYSNNMLVILNFRARIRGGRGDDSDDSVMVVDANSNSTMTSMQQSEHLGFRKSFKAMFSRSPARMPIIFSTINIQMTQEFETEDEQLPSIYPIKSHQNISESSHSVSFSKATV